MVELNLLVSRKEQVLYENKIVKRYLLTGFVTAFIALLCSHVLLMGENLQKEKAVNLLQQAVPSHSSQHNDINEDGDFSAEDVLQLMSMLAKTKTDGVCYTTILRQSVLLQLQGNAWTMAAVSSALQQLGRVDVSSPTHLLNVTENPKSAVLQFTLATGEL